MEINNTSEWFHGTLTPEIKEFRRFTHFGTEDAALECIRRHQEDETGEGILMRVNLCFSPEDVVELNDWGTAKSIGIALALRNKYRYEKDEESIKRCEVFEAIKVELDERKSNNEESEDIGFLMLFIAFKCFGIKVLRYKNKGEIDCEGYALCVADPSVVTIPPIDDFKSIDEIFDI